MSYRLHSNVLLLCMMFNEKLWANEKKNANHHRYGYSNFSFFIGLSINYLALENNKILYQCIG